jgi:hypothetical protein
MLRQRSRRQCGRECHTTANKLSLQAASSSEEVSGNRPRFAAQQPCGRFLASTIEDTQCECRPIFLGQALHFLIKHRLQFAQRRVGDFDIFWTSSLMFMFVSSRHVTFRALGHAEGRPVQPTRQRIGLADARRLPRQDEERHLENVLCVVLVPQSTVAYAPDQPGVPPQQSLECRVVTVSDEAL